MAKILKLILFIFLGILVFSFIIHKIPLSRIQKSQILTKPSLSEAEKTLKKLTLEQKIGQLFLIGFVGKALNPELENLIKEIHPGGILLLQRNIENAEQLKRLIQDLQKISSKETNLPLFIAVDQEGEPMCRIKWLDEKTPQAEIKDETQAYQVGLKRGEELKELGINLNLAPVLDIVQRGDFLFERSFQKDPQITGELAKALIFGQKTAGILTAIKHFPGYGGISFNPERTKLPVLSKIPEISQFKKATEAQPEIVMTANVIYSEINQDYPFSLSSRDIQFLKENFKNDFLIISDDLSSPVFKKKFSLEKTIILAVKSGVNILIVAGFDEPKDSLLAFDALFKAVKDGEISESEINNSALEIIKLKQNLLY